MTTLSELVLNRVEYLKQFPQDLPLNLHSFISNFRFTSSWDESGTDWNNVMLTSIRFLDPYMLATFSVIAANYEILVPGIMLEYFSKQEYRRCSVFCFTFLDHNPDQFPFVEKIFGTEILEQLKAEKESNSVV